MTDFRKLAESTSETVRDLVSQVIIKHELAALEIMHELKAENVSLRAAAEQARAALSELTSLKDMKDRLTELREMGHGTDWDSYHRRKPLAWPAARDALRALDEALK